jgi:hypothetical protein
MNKYIIAIDGSITSKYNDKIMSTYKDKKGYHHITLHVSLKPQIRKTFLVHRLVAKEHLPNPLNLPQVNHKDGNKSNNKASNLEWCTGQQNVAHSVLHKLIPVAQQKVNSKCSVEDILEMRKLRTESKLTYYELGRRFKISYQAAHRICTFQTYK